MTIFVKMDENLENECEDLVDELSDMRQRYPAYCSYKLSKIMAVTREINTMNMKTDSIHFGKIGKPLQLEGERREIYESLLSNISNRNRNPDSKKTCKSLLSNLNDLIKIAEQLRTDKQSPIGRTIQKLTQDEKNDDQQ